MAFNRLIQSFFFSSESTNFNIDFATVCNLTKIYGPITRKQASRTGKIKVKLVESPKRYRANGSAAILCIC